MTSDRERQHEFTMKQFKNVCKGTNCNASDAFPYAHSKECQAEHDACYKGIVESDGESYSAKVVPHDITP